MLSLGEMMNRLCIFLFLGFSAVTATAQAGSDSLKATFESDFYVGAALSREFASKKGQARRELVKREFNSVTSENSQKWSSMNPKPGDLRLEAADEFVRFGSDQGMYVVGHVLFWHNQTPDWVYEDSNGQPLNRKELLTRMEQRVKHAANRYGKNIDAWDVVNEAYLENGTLRETKWRQIVGDDFVEQAFRIADKEMPSSVELIYNDYGMTEEGKRKAVVEMVRDLKRKGVRIDGVGMQGHWTLNHPSIELIEASIVAFANEGVDVHISELDIDVLPDRNKAFGANVKKTLESTPSNDPYKDGLPQEMQRKLADRYAAIFGLFYKHRDKVKRVTFWGVTDGHSWLNNWPIKGRTNHALLFDRHYERKPAYRAVIEVKKGAGA